MALPQLLLTRALVYSRFSASTPSAIPMMAPVMALENMVPNDSRYSGEVFTASPGLSQPNIFTRLMAR